MKAYKGITLIALVITIIIMLILVAVTINMTVRGGLLGYAGNAVMDTTAAKVYEQLDEVKMAWSIEDRTNPDAAISIFLESEKSKGNIDNYTDLGEGHYTIEKDGYERPINGEIYFYIYHSSDNTVETIKHRAEETFNIYNKSKPGYFYGGYYSDYEGKGSYAGDGVEVKDGTEIAYNGMNAKWYSTDILSENGTQMNPEAGKTYYLKEVPTSYFHQAMYETHTGTSIGKLFLFLGLDDNFYRETGFLINSMSNQVKGKIVKSVTLALTTGSIKIEPYMLFGTFGQTEGGCMSYKDIEDYVEENAVIKVIPYWITPDYILVLGTDRRQYELNDLTTTNLTSSYIDGF